MVGYRNLTKGYRQYDATQGRVFHSCDVQFNEQVKEHGQNTQTTDKSNYHLIAEFSEFEVPEMEMAGDATQPEQIKE